MGRKFLICFAAAFTCLLIVGCNDEKTVEEKDGGGFDVRFALPVGIETYTDSLTFTVIDGKAPLLSDSFVLEPVVKEGKVSYSFPCAIVGTSPSEFTVALLSSCTSGQYNVFIKRGDEKKEYGEFYLACVRIGETLPNWFEGELDINFISTGHGECTWQIFPDGTTFLVDASGAIEDDRRSVWRPNEDVTAGHTIVDYINHFSPSASAGHINYFMLTHHDSDHMGSTSGMATHSSGLFKLSSLCEIGSELVMDKVLDVDWPDFLCPKGASNSTVVNYVTFLDWTASSNGTEIEKWRVGYDAQVVPLHSSDWDVVVRSYAGGAYFWTGGADEETVRYIPDDLSALSDSEMPGENCFSCAYILSYGNFDFYLGGDLQYNGRDTYSYKDAETPLAGVVHKVEVMKADHHGCPSTNSTEYINKLAPDVWLVGVWGETISPSAQPMNDLLAASPNCDVFCTYQGQENLDALGEENASHIVGTGHIVVRVAPGGDSYMVYTLIDTDEEYVVDSIHGPYHCEK